MNEAPHIDVILVNYNSGDIMIRNVFVEFHHEFMKLDRKFFGDIEGLR